MTEYHDTFLEGNERIEAAIRQYHTDSSRENLIGILEAIRQRMHEDGHFIFPVLVDEEDENNFAFRSIQTNDGKIWNAAFTSQTEYEKGEPSRVLSNFIDSTMKMCLESETDGFVINPWGKYFLLERDMIEMIFNADGDVEYSVPDDPITAELLEDGSFLKRAVGICSRNRTQLNLIKLARILRDSWVWVPCGDILRNGDQFFFPVFTTAEEMGEYGEHFSKVQRHFLEAVNLAKNNEKDVAGIVINAFSEPFVVPGEMFDIIAEMESSLA